MESSKAVPTNVQLPQHSQCFICLQVCLDLCKVTALLTVSPAEATCFKAMALGHQADC